MNANTPLTIVNILEEARLGGPQLSAALLARHLAGMQCAVTIYTARRNSGPFADMLAHQNIAVRAIPLCRLQSGFANQLRYLLTTPVTIWRYRTLLSRDKPDIVHVNGAAQWRGAFAAWLTGIPCAWTLNDTRMPALVRMLFAKITHRFANGFIAVAKRVEEYYPVVHTADVPVARIPAPVDIDRFKGAETVCDPEIAAIAGTRIANTAHNNPDKDLETFVRTAHLVGERLKGAVTFVQIGGQFEEQAKYVSRITGLRGKLGDANVRFLGTREDIPAILAACDFYFCSSRSEASPMAVWEALAAGLPVVSTDVGDIQNLNETGKFGRVEPVGDPDRLAAAICSMVTESTWHAKSTRDRIRKYASDHFAAPEIARAHLRFYHEILGSGVERK